MSIQWARYLTAGAIVLAAVVGVSGCSGASGSSNGDSGGRTGSNGQSSQGASTGGSTGSTGAGTSAPGVIAPIIVDLSSIDGTTVDVSLNNVVVLESGDVKVTVWTGSVADPKVAEFVAGKDDGSATFNPGVKPLAVGETTVTVTNSDSGKKFAFDLKVTS